jgi:hypothetical protein
MIKKISRKRFLEKYPNFPVASYYKNKYHFPETYNNNILYVEAKSTIGLCKNIAEELSKLIRLLNYDQLLFLGDTNTTWLFRSHDYKPVKAGLDFLIKKKVSKSFNGALQVDLTELSEFLKHIFWLVRCNGVVFTPHFSDSGFNVIISICQYGNVHLSTLNKHADQAFNEAILQTGLYIQDDSECRSFKIPHRKSTRV